MIRDYNERANEIMNRYGISIFDSFQVLMDVFDQSYDGAHYSPPVTDALRAPLGRILEKKIGGSSSKVEEVV